MAMRDRGRMAMFGCAFLLLATAPGCRLKMIPGLGSIVGSGNIVEEQRTVPDFTELEVGAAFRAKYVVGETPGVVLKGDDNLLPLVMTEVRDGRLVVALKPGKGISPTQPIVVVATAPAVTTLAASGAARLEAERAEGMDVSVEVSGAASVQCDDLDARELRLALAGASRARIGGAAGRIEVNASGASNAKLGELRVEECRVDASGASTVETNARASVTGRASGASRVLVSGKAERIDVATSGASSVKRVK